MTGKPFSLVSQGSLLLLISPLLLVAQAEEEIETLPAYEVGYRLLMGETLPPGPQRVLWDRDLLETQLGQPVDMVLKSYPGFQLFRRAGSLTAHPATQGVSLRNLGPNAAGRALVLLQGIPLNDPFGGYVPWSVTPALWLEQAGVVVGGAPGQYGSQALSGVVHLTEFQAQDTGEGRLHLSAGNYDTYEATFVGGGAITDRISGSGVIHGFTSAGFDRIPIDDRGSIDSSMKSENFRVGGTLGFELTSTLRLETRGSWYKEKRRNGSPEALNETEGWDVSAKLGQGGMSDPFRWEGAVYFQDRAFANQFTSIQLGREAERPVLNQYSVPAQGWGMSWMGDWVLDSDWQIRGGVDARWLEGETNEEFRNLGAGFTRDREAGGEQRFVGGWTELAIPMAEVWQLKVGARLEQWSLVNGRRIERNLETGDLIREDRFADRDDLTGTFRVDLERGLGRGRFAVVSAYQSYRLPTFNELYRPFRVGNDITEANPNLDAETLYGVDFGLYFPHDDERGGLQIQLFFNRLNDAVTNVTLEEVDSGQFVSPCGFVPGGGSCRERQNVDALEGWGLGVNWNRSLHPQFQVDLAYQFSQMEFSAGAGQSSLDGRSPAQTPDHLARVSGIWTPIDSVNLRLDGIWSDTQFEDDLNRRVLDGYIRVDARIDYTWKPGRTLYISGINLTDAAIENSVSATGLVTLAERFSWRIGFVGSF